MLTVDEKEVIRRDYFIHRKSMRQIARERQLINVNYFSRCLTSNVTRKCKPQAGG